MSWLIAADGPAGPQYKQDLFRVDTALAHRYHGRGLSDAENLYAEFVDVARSGAPHEKLRSDMNAAANAPWLDDLAIPDDSNWIWAWASVRVPVLLVFGAGDQLVPVQQSIAETSAILKQHGNGQVRTRIFAGADHTLHIPPSTPDGWPKLPSGFPAIIVTFSNGVWAAPAPPSPDP